MNEIVKYDNYMNNLCFKKFKAVELDLLMVLCSKLRNTGTDTIILTFSELKKLSGDTKHSNKEYISSLKSMNRKLMDIVCEIETNGRIIMFVLFPTFEINAIDETLTVCVNERFKFILNEITKNFTRFELNEFVGLDSRYSKNLYRLLKQFKTTGKYEVTIEEFRKKMNCPESYSNKYIKDLIVNPSLKELGKYFKNLKCETKYARKRGRPVEGYKFTFCPEEVPVQKKKRPDKVSKEKTVNPKNNYMNFSQRKYDSDELERILLEKNDYQQCNDDEIKEMMKKLNIGANLL